MRVLWTCVLLLTTALFAAQIRLHYILERANAIADLCAHPKCEPAAYQSIAISSATPAPHPPPPAYPPAPAT